MTSKLARQGAEIVSMGSRRRGNDGLLKDNGGSHFAQDASFNRKQYRKLDLHWGGLITRGWTIQGHIPVS
jgi:hypothetical protein